MCGIIGYTGVQAALPHLLTGLSALEYRGYDSTGVAVSLPDTEELLTVRARGKLNELRERLKTHPQMRNALCGIGHTRWATHGAPDDKNAHPQTTPHLALVHNGIIENESELRAEILSRGITLTSETDTEVAAWIIDGFYASLRDPVAALFAAAQRLRGSFAFALLFADRPGRIYAIRRDSPLILAHTDHGTLLASDVTAIVPHSHEYIRLQENTVACLHIHDVTLIGRDGHPVPHVRERVDWNVEGAQKGGYPHFMRKEIDEQPEALSKTLSPRIRGNMPHFGIRALDTDDILRFRSVRLIACGTAMHAGLVGQRLIEQIARIPARVEIASEFRYRDPLLDPDRELCILLTQSGETADTLAALRHAKGRGVTTLAVVNVVGSSIAREADLVLYTHAGPEIAVASTKAYSVQCALLTLLALRLAHANGRITLSEMRVHLSTLEHDLPNAVATALTLDAAIAALAPTIARHEHLFFIGRGMDADLCTEGSLKLKEISYIHSEAYPAGELKHGTISLITHGTPVVALMTKTELCEKMLSAIREVSSRGAWVLVITTEEISRQLGSLPGDALLTLPTVPPFLTPFPAVTVLQLLAYHVAVARGCDVDQPRNLAKSVTVE